MGESPFPLMLNVRDRRVLVVGGGPIAARKIAALLEGGAAVVVVAPTACEAVESWAADGRLSWTARRFEPSDCSACTLVFAATDDADVNDAVVRASRVDSALVCVSGPATEEADFLVPAVVHEPPITATVSTGTPALTAQLRGELQGIAERWRTTAALLAAVRPLVRRHGAQSERATFFRELVAAAGGGIASAEEARLWLSEERAGLELGHDVVERVVASVFDA